MARMDFTFEISDLRSGARSGIRITSRSRGFDHGLKDGMDHTDEEGGRGIWRWEAEYHEEMNQSMR